MLPYLPISKPKYVIIDYRANDDVLRTIKKLNIEIIKTIKCSELQDPVVGHPDMVLHPITNRKIIVAPNVFHYYKEVFAKKDIKIIKGEKFLCRNYPDNIAYNIARIGEYAFHNFKYTDPVVKYYFEKEKLNLININQGYSKCSTAIIDNKAIITSDYAIHNRALEIKLNSLFINSYFVELKGYNHGFIGGAVSRIEKNAILFTGAIDDTNSFFRINKFLNSLGFSTIIASKKIITDLGTIIPIL